MPKEYYKLVREAENGEYRSIYASARYKVGEWTKASVGGLLVYDRISSARMEYRGHKQIAQLHLFLIEASEPMELPPYRLSIEALDRTNQWVKKVWETSAVELNRAYYADTTGFARALVAEWPLGTVAFRKVKLTQETRC